ncbi:Arginyl-tRNA--protein transferase 1 [Sporothrix stenoceras]
MSDAKFGRSGTLLYRPNQKDACCPHYSIRLDSDAFHASRDQRQAINRFNRYIIGDSYAKQAARVNPRSRADAKRRDTTFDLLERIHEAESDKLPVFSTSQTSKSSKKQKANGSNDGEAPPAPTPAESESAKTIEPAHRFEVTLEPDTYTDEKYAVFENYQRIVHKEPPSKISKKGFTGFLCDSPLRRETITDKNGREKKLGSYHQCYWLDGRLVAVGILDLLPDCVSAVYFMYHESIHDWSPGKLGALREIALAMEGGYRWWYSGYYIHNCPKMRYKIDFSPQYILDPELPASWDLLDKKALALLDKKAYVSLSHERLMEYKRELQAKHPDGHIDGNGDKYGFGLFGLGKAPAFHAPAVDEPVTTEGAENIEGIDAATDAASEDWDEQENSNPSDNNSEDDEDDGGDGPRRPLFTSNMPGLPPMTNILRFQLDNIPILTSTYPDRMFPVNLLTVWEDGTITDGTSFKNKVAELVAMMGSDLTSQLCLDYRGHR